MAQNHHSFFSQQDKKSLFMLFFKNQYFYQERERSCCKKNCLSWVSSQASPNFRAQSSQYPFLWLPSSISYSSYLGHANNEISVKIKLLLTRDQLLIFPPSSSLWIEQMGFWKHLGKKNIDLLKPATVNCKYQHQKDSPILPPFLVTTIILLRNEWTTLIE